MKRNNGWNNGDLMDVNFSFTLNDEYFKCWIKWFDFGDWKVCDNYKNLKWQFKIHYH